MNVREAPPGLGGAAVLAGKSNDPKRVSRQYLVFVVAGMEMAVSLERVSEIVPYERVSAVPGTPPYVRGVVHVRDRVIPVADLAVKLQRTPEAVGKRTCILMLELMLGDERFPVGIVMDGVATLLDVDGAQIRPAPRFGASVEVKYLEGLLPTERGMLPLIDMNRVFASDELAEVALVARDGKADES